MTKTHGQKSFNRQLLLPLGPADVVPSEHMEFDFSDVFGPFPVQGSIEVNVVTSENFVSALCLNEKVYDDPVVVHNRSHSLVGPTTCVSPSFQLSKLTLHETESSLEIVECASGEIEGEQDEQPICGSEDHDTKSEKTEGVGLDDFEVMKVVGQGAFGKVFQVKKKSTSEIYAMKVMRKDKIMEKNHAEYMKAERDILTQVDHSFIVQLRYSFQRAGLKSMMQSEEWLNSRFQRTTEGIEMEKIILNNDFWRKLEKLQSSIAPLIHVLRMVDGDKHPVMGLIYDAIDRAKLAIAEVNDNKQEQYMKYWKIIDDRWEATLHSPLHAAGYFLNPALRFRDEFSQHREVRRGLQKVIGTLLPDMDSQLEALSETKYRLYLVLDFVNGGHLFFQLYRHGLFREDLARLYTAEIVSAVSHLHANGIMHRDLKPENILLDADGHAMLTDFGLAKHFEENARSNSMCGTVEYMAPEIILGKGHDKAADWWSVGILMFEMLTGKPPYVSGNRQKIQQKIVKDKIKLPAYLSSEAHSLLKGLLQKESSKRLGGGPGGNEEIKNHKWFKPINWRKLDAREIQPSFRPNVSGKNCIANFEDRWTSMPLLDSPVASPVAGDCVFRGFSYVRPTILQKPSPLG